ncbi:MAG: DUF58 domain-containing protein [Acidimicrobiia bacterium]|nr:DUF58 domain-containing protein [Acidimicrobiia bacterium]
MRQYQDGDDVRRIDWNVTAPPCATCTSARTSPTASSSAGSSPTSRPVSTSAPPTARSATWPWRRSPRSGSSPPGSATGSAPCSSRPTVCAPFPRSRAGPTCWVCSTTS